MADVVPLTVCVAPLVVAVNQIPQFVDGALLSVVGSRRGAVAGQILDELATGHRPFFLLRRHGPQDGPLGALRQIRHQLPRRRQLIVNLLHPGIERTVGAEGQLAGHHLVEGGAQRVDVAAGVGVLGVAELLGGHEVRCTQTAAGLGQVEVGVGRLDQAEVGELGDAVGRDEDVVRLDVAMDQPLLVRPVQPLGHLHDQAHCLVVRHPAAALQEGASDSPSTYSMTR